MGQGTQDTPTSRRGFFREAMAGLLAPVVALVQARLEAAGIVRPEGPEAPVLRPPGAVAGDAFGQLCDACGACAEACAVGAIVLDPVPRIDPAVQGCVLCPDLPCIAACPTAALASTAREQVSMGLAVWDPARCVVTAGEECGLCQQACPVEGTIRIDGRELHLATDTCVGCGCCHTVCPADPRAITVEPF
jgi:ferredoxin-type protein NapG